MLALPVQDDLRPVEQRNRHRDSPAVGTGTRLGLSPVVTGNPGFHRHRPGCASPGSAGRYPTASVSSSATTGLSVSDASRPGLRNSRSTGGSFFFIHRDFSDLKMRRSFLSLSSLLVFLLNQNVETQSDPEVLRVPPSQNTIKCLFGFFNTIFYWLVLVFLCAVLL